MVSENKNDGEKVDPSLSFRQDFPEWEPKLGSLTTDDGYDLVKSLAKQTVRRSDTNVPIAVVGLEYTVLSHADAAGMLDSVAAPFGGRAVVGKALVRSGRAHRFAPHVVSAVVRLPKAVSEMMSSALRVKDTARHGAYIAFRSSHD